MLEMWAKLKLEIEVLKLKKHGEDLVITKITI